MVKPEKLIEENKKLIAKFIGKNNGVRANGI
jgi:hypothetical protein